MIDFNDFDEADIGHLLRLLRQIAAEPGDPRTRQHILHKALEALLANPALHPRLAEIIRQEIKVPPPQSDPPQNTRFPDKLPALAPRHRRVLQRLLSGDSEKQVARSLGLSPHTVHEYVKSIYRSFGVESRGELLAHWIGRPIRQQEMPPTSRAMPGIPVPV